MRRAPSGAAVFIVEGEQDRDCLANVGLVATTNVFGARNKVVDYTPSLPQRTVVVAPASDTTSCQHAVTVIAALH